MPHELVGTLLVDGCEVTGSQHHQPYWFQLVWVHVLLVGNVVNVSQLMGVLVSAKKFKAMAQDVIYSPYGGTKISLTLFQG